MTPTLNLVRSNLEYEAVFHRPAFDLAGVPERAVKTIYDELASHWDLPLNKIELLRDTNLGAARIRISLFSELATFEIFLDRYLARFIQLRTKDDWDIAIACLDRLEVGLASGLSDFSLSSGTARLDRWYQCDGGPEAVKTVLDDLGGGLSGIATGFVGASQLGYSLGFFVQNKDERWTLQLRLEPSRATDSHLYLNWIANYDQGGRYSSLDDRKSHIADLSRQVLVSSGFALPSRS